MDPTNLIDAYEKQYSDFENYSAITDVTCEAVCIIDESEVEKEERTTLQTSSGIFSRLHIILHPEGATPTT